MLKYVLYFIAICLPSQLFSVDYAFLISAGQATRDDKGYNSEYWYDLYLAYEELINVEGFTHENVIVFYGNGNDFEATKYARFRREHNNWTNSITDFNNQRETILQVFEDFGDIINENDNVIIRWVVGHGGVNANGYWAATGDGIMTSFDFGRMFRFISRFRFRKIIWMTCNAGAWANSFFDDNTITITSSRDDEESHGLWYGPGNKLPGGEMNYVLTSSLSGVEPFGNPLDVDQNNDNLINIDEVFDEVSTNSILRSTPQINDPCNLRDFTYIRSEILMNDITLSNEHNYLVNDFETNGSVVLSSGSQTAVYANDQIVLNPGFIANIGSNFLATSDNDICFRGSGKGNITIPEVMDVCFATSLQISPNPFSGETNISISLKEENKISLVIYDLLGNKTAVLADNVTLSGGTHTFTFSGSAHSSGIYYVVLSTPQERISKPIVLAE